MIRVQALHKSYGSTKALKGVSFEVKRGEIVGFLGPNGAGKTTTMKILAGYMDADSGEVTVGNFDGCSQSLEVKRIIGYLPENNPLYTDMLVIDYLYYVASLYSVPAAEQESRVKSIASACGISDRLHQPIGELSKGYRQRVGIASVLVHDPDVLILDEPTVGLDPNQILEIRQLIKDLAKKKTVILCSHILSEIEATCQRVLIIHDGKIVAEGTPAQIRKQAKGKTLLLVTLEAPKGAKPAMLEAAFLAVDGVEAVTACEEESKGVYRFTLDVKDSAELRKAVMQAANKAKVQVLELASKETTLEDAFTALTT